MSKKDYTKFSNHRVMEEKPVEIRNEIQEVEETIVEATEEIVEKKQPDVFGVVVDCIKLNVRKVPHSEADILCTVDASTNLVIDHAESTKDFYKVCTAAGIEGYCMRKFVKVL